MKEAADFEDRRLYPMKFLPIFKEKVWGGENIRKILGLNYGDKLKNCGEAWILSGMEGDESVVANGFLEGNTLVELVEVYMSDLVGEKIYQKFGLQFPLLFKWIDAADDLSVQVHPDDALSMEREIGLGKSEMWFIRSAHGCNGEHHGGEHHGGEHHGGEHCDGEHHDGKHHGGEHHGGEHCDGEHHDSKHHGGEHHAGHCDEGHVHSCNHKRNDRHDGSCDCDSGHARLVCGFKPGTNQMRYLKALQNNNLESVLQWGPVHAGDFFYIPAGTVHAIGKGILLAEIQQSSDTTYRIHDWNRLGLDGKPRELHVEQALKALKFNSKDFPGDPPGRVDFHRHANQSNTVVDSPEFTVNYLPLLQGIEKDFSDLDSFVVYLCSKGAAVIKADDKAVEIRQGELVLLPAITERVRIFPDTLGCELLETYIEM